MRELSTLDKVRFILRAAGMEDYGDGDIVTDVLVGYAEPGYGSFGSESVIILGNYNTRRYVREGDAPLSKAERLPERVANLLTAVGAECEWYDEWAQCSHCYRAVRTQPDSYSWTPSYAWVEECEIVCADCLRENPSWIIDEYVNNAEKALTVLGRTELEALGFVKQDGEYASGWYGQEDNPAAILETLLKFSPEGTEVVFTVDGVGQFEARFSAWTRTPEQD